MRQAARRDANARSVVDALTAIGVLAESLERAGNDVPDLLCIRAGRVVLLEVKTEDGTVSEGQSAFIESWRWFGGEAYVVRSPDEALELFGVRKRVQQALASEAKTT